VTKCYIFKVTYSYNKVKNDFQGINNMKMLGLYEIRKKKGYSQLKVAMDLNMSREAISYYENGKRSPDIETLLILSDYFNVSIDYLITGKDFSSK